jgi:dihydrofolate synthase / folylpolyglutamate synthase
LNPDYQQTVQYLFDHLPMYQRVGVLPHKMDLTKTLLLSEVFGNPHHQIRSIHIAGTNGKGSVSHMLSSICTAAGLKTGLYTSPHYKDFRERIKIDGQLISEEEVIDFVNQYRSKNLTIQPSFFELTVVMAFDYFARKKVDVAVIETGLGGRLDSTNIITPMLSVITNISYDHMTILGDTLPQIAAEKAGIIKSEVPVVIGEYRTETAQVFSEKANELNSIISFADQNWEAIPQKVNVDFASYKIVHLGKIWNKTLKADLIGSYQKFNIQTILEATRYLKKKLPISDENILTGLANVKSISNFFGRWEILNKQPLTIADSAHNEGGIRLALEQLLSLPARQLHIVIGMVKDKDHQQVLSQFPKSATYYFSTPNIPRGLDAKRLQQIATEFDLLGDAYDSVQEALNAAKKNAHKKDVIFVGGSSFVVAEIV